MSLRKIAPKTESSMMEGPARSSKERKIFPHFRIELVHLPEAKKWDIGKEYTITLKLKMTGISISRFQNDAEFEIIAIDPKAEAEEKEEKEEKE